MLHTLPYMYHYIISLYNYKCLFFFLLSIREGIVSGKMADLEVYKGEAK